MAFCTYIGYDYNGSSIISFHHHIFLDKSSIFCLWFFFPTDKSGVVQHSHSSLITLIIALSTSCATWYISHSNLCFGRLHILRTCTHYIHTVLPLNTILFFLSHMSFLNKSPFSLKLETGHEEIIYNVIYKCLLSSAFSTQGKGIANLLHSSWWSADQIWSVVCFHLSREDGDELFFFSLMPNCVFSVLHPFFFQIWKKTYPIKHRLHSSY